MWERAESGYKPRAVQLRDSSAMRAATKAGRADEEAAENIQVIGSVYLIE